MKFLTVLFILYYTFELFNQSKFIRKYIVKYKGLTDEEYSDKIKDELSDKDTLKQTFKFIGLILLIGFIPPVVEIVYIAFAFQYADMVTLAYLLFWLSVFTMGRYRSKKVKGKFLLNENIGKYSIRQMFIHIIDLSYFVYMFYILFMK